MIIFGTSVYMGFSLKEASEIKAALANANIKYKEKVINHSSMSTSRTHFGNFGINKDYEIQYEIIVKSKDAENAKFIIESSNKR